MATVDLKRGLTLTVAATKGKLFLVPGSLTWWSAFNARDVRCRLQGFLKPLVAEGKVLDLGGGEGQLAGQLMVASSELRVPGDEPDVFAGPLGGAGGGRAEGAEFLGDAGEASAERGVAEAELPGQRQDAGAAVGLAAGLEHVGHALADQGFGEVGDPASHAGAPVVRVCAVRKSEISEWRCRSRCRRSGGISGRQASRFSFPGPGGDVLRREDDVPAGQGLAAAVFRKSFAASALGSFAECFGRVMDAGDSTNGLIEGRRLD